MRTAVVCLCILAGSSLTCSRPARNDDGPHIEARGVSNPIADFKLSIPQSSIREGDKIVAQFALHNRANHSLWINKRMVFNDGTAPPELRDVWIDVKRLDGGRVQPDCVAKSLPATDADYAVLPAGAEVAVRENVSCLNLSAGRYLLLAHYRDANAHPPYEPAGAVWLGNELLSDPVAVEIAKGGDKR
jgi:hypothetical protein